MASHETTPVRELSDAELRKRLLTLGYDVPVSVNREFLLQKLEKAGGASAGGKTKKQQRHSMAVTSPSSSSGTSGSSSPARKRKSIAATPNNVGGSSRSHSNQHNNVSASTPMSPLATSSPLPPATPHYMGSPGSSISMNTPSTPSPFVSRLNTPSPSSSPHNMNNGETGNHSPRYMNYYNMFKTSSSGGGDTGGDMGGGYGYSFNRGIRMSAPPGSFNPVTSVAPSRSSDRNGYTAGGGTGLGVESDWCGGHLVSKVLVILFVLFFAIIGVLYVSKFMAVDQRGLTASTSDGKEDNIVREPPPIPTPPPAKKKVEVPPPLTSMVYPVCGLKGVDPEACIPKEVVKNSRTLFNALKEELTQRARKIGCHSEIKDAAVSIKEAKTSLYQLVEMKKSDIDAAFQGMLLLVTENPRGGLSLHGEENDDNEISSRDVATLDFSSTKISATGVHPDFICEVKSMFFSLTLYITFGVGLIGAGYLGWKGYKIYRKRKQSEQDELYKMVERVLQLLRKQYEHSEMTQGAQPQFLAVNHVRDELIPPNERLRKEAFWSKVVNYISNHESRVREEVQHISGEEFKVWRWLPSASPLASARFSSSTANSQHHSRSRFSMPGSPYMSSSPVSPVPGYSPSQGTMSPPPPPPQQSNLYPSLSTLATLSDDDGDDYGGGDGDNNSNNKWQGQAFETCEGSPNALPTTPTPCLKIRHMFTESRDVEKERTRIEQHILEKCSQAKILHIGIDTSSVEGCVYIRCMSKEDAGNAFKALHGWWFEGKLLSVKFLREERYFSRFPEAKRCTVPLRLSR